MRVRHAGGNAGKAWLRQLQWLLIEWPAGHPEPVKYVLSTMPEETPLNELASAAHQRWRIKRDYQDLKQDFGLGHYEGRGWRRFHHHTTLSIAAYGFLMAERLTADKPVGGKKNFISRQVPPVPTDDVPRGSPARAASRGPLNHDTATQLEPQAHRPPRTVPLLRRSKRKAAFFSTAWTATGRSAPARTWPTSRLTRHRRPRLLPATAETGKSQPLSVVDARQDSGSGFGRLVGRTSLQAGRPTPDASARRTADTNGAMTDSGNGETLLTLISHRT